MGIEIRDGFAYYPCGCKFRVIDVGPPIRIDFVPLIENVPLDCSLTWKLIGDGNTKGVFQLETKFAQQNAKKLKPENIEHLAALTSILRPGCSQSRRDNKTVTDHYIDRKNNIEPVTFEHPILESILSTTYGEMIYQEQAMEIARIIAGFTLQEADEMRKAIGKKKADLMAKVKIKFMDGCKKLGIVTEEEAAIIFDGIEKSQRYAFNKSHAVSYAIEAYLSAYAKAHFKRAFFTSYLYYAKDKTGKKFDEIKLLIMNARLNNIDVYPPDYRILNPHFKHVGENIYFGFTDIRKVGDSVMQDIQAATSTAETILAKPRKDFKWLEFLIFVAPHIKSDAMEGIIESGALDYLGQTRTKMMFEYEAYMGISDKEQAWLQQSCLWNTHDNLPTLLEVCLNHTKAGKLGFCKTKTRATKVTGIIQTLRNPPYKLQDSPEWLARVEEAKLGVSLTTTPIDSCKNADQANTTCQEFVTNNCRTSGIFIAAQIEELNTHLTRNGANPGSEMAFMVVSDGTATLDCVIFPDTWAEVKKTGFCIEENTVLLAGERGRNGGDSFIVKKIWQLS